MACTFQTTIVGNFARLISLRDDDIDNKRAMMALNRSPEFKSSNPNPSAAELFGT